MSDREKEILTKITEAIPAMSDFDKGYLLGKVEQMAADKSRGPQGTDPQGADPEETQEKTA